MRSPVILRVFKDQQLLEVKQFDQDQIVIGQQAEVSLDLSGEGVAPIHCLIEMRDSGHYLCDLGSKTGTFKNGQAILDERIESGDEITIGPYKISFFVGVPKPKVAPKPGLSAPPPLSATPPPAPAPAVASAAKPAAASQAPAEKKSAVPSIAAVKAAPKPEIRGAGGRIGESRRRRRGGSFAPASDIQDLRQALKPGKGNVVEVIVAWRERVLTTHHFRTRGVVRVGSSGRDQIQVPSASLPKGFNLLELGQTVKVNFASDMDFELVSAQGRRKIEDCLGTGKASKGSLGYSVRLDQSEMICLSLSGGNVQLFVRFAPQAPVVPMVPPLLLSGSELTGIVLSTIVVGLLAFYISATTPKDLYETQQDEITRIAQVIFNKPPDTTRVPPPPPPPPPPPEKPTPPPPPDPQKAKVADQKQEIQKKGAPAEKAEARSQTAGRAAEVAPIPNSQNRPKKFTSTRQGGAVKLGEKEGANSASTKDVSKVGLFSAFGGGGVRTKLDQAYSGAGEVLGQADKATGTTGMGQNRAGDDLGSRFKDTGAGGKGTATQGISGIGTKGRGSGQSAYGSLDGLGSKTTVAIEPGGAEEDFIGTIDKEAVRRRVKHYLHEIRGCYVRELNRLERGMKLEGKVVVSWEIIARGVAKNVRVKSSTLNSPNVENCIRDRLASWSFPEPPVGMTAEVSYPFYMRPEQ